MIRRAILASLFVAPLTLGLWASNASVVSFPLRQAATVLPAFPGARGYGAIALADTLTEINNNCRSKPVALHHVTNTNDAGAGSFRQIMESAISNAFLDIVLFDVGGSLILLSELRASGNENCLYVAGQSAPGGGFQITSTLKSLLRWDGDDVVIRYLTIIGQRLSPTDVGGSNISLIGNRKIILDQMSISAGADKNLAIDQAPGSTPTVNDLTLSNSILYIPANDFGSNINILGDGDTSPDSTIGNLSLLGNYFGGRGRNPRAVDVRNIQVVNHLLYGYVQQQWRLFTGEVGATRMKAEFLRSYTKGHLSASPSPNFTGQIECFDLSLGIPIQAPNIYSQRNINVSTTPQIDSLGDHTFWRWWIASTCSLHGNLVADSVFKATPTLNPRPRFDADTSSLQAAILAANLLPVVGNYRGLNCDGTWKNRRNILDIAFVAEFNDSTWIGGTLSDGSEGTTVVPYGGIPSPATGTTCADGDADGLPDAYEAIHGALTTTGDTDADGFWNIEERLAGTDPNVFTNPDGSEAGGSQLPTTYGTLGAASARYIYYDTFGQYTTGSITRLLPDTSRYGIAVADVRFGFVQKILRNVARGDPILIFADDSIKGVVTKQLDSLAAFDTIAAWNLAGFNEDSLKAWIVP